MRNGARLTTVDNSAIRVGSDVRLAIVGLRPLGEAVDGPAHARARFGQPLAGLTPGVGVSGRLDHEQIVDIGQDCAQLVAKLTICSLAALRASRQSRCCGDSSSANSPLSHAACSRSIPVLVRRLMPYASGSSTEERPINLAIFVMLHVSESGNIESNRPRSTPSSCPWPASWGATPPSPPETRSKKGRSPDFRGYGLKTTQMAELTGRLSKHAPAWERIADLHIRRFGH
jgi:hypothetical protein